MCATQEVIAMKLLDETFGGDQRNTRERPPVSEGT